jgi:putative FmdB family regulatory protein
MPTYAYACTACDHRLDVVQSFSDDPLTECPECGGRLRKVFGSVGVVFKGSGFYRTDSRAASAATSGSDGGKDGAAPKEAAKGGDSTSAKPAAPAKESKPAAPAAAKGSAA